MIYPYRLCFLANLGFRNNGRASNVIINENIINISMDNNYSNSNTASNQKEKKGKEKKPKQIIPRTSEQSQHIYIRIIISVASFLSHGTTAGSPPYISSPSHESLYSRRRSVQGRSNIKIEDGLSGWFRRSGIIIDHVTNFSWARGRLSLNVPVVTIKRRIRSNKRGIRNGRWKEKGEGRSILTYSNFTGYNQPNA